MSSFERTASFCLATYGSLAPGRVNRCKLAGLQDSWRRGTVWGRLVASGWGAKHGYPGLVLDPHGSPVEVYLLESSELPGHLRHLDDFEGVGYRRVLKEVQTANGEVDAWIYVLASE
jgi:gamma-glutamylcyclotransferase (GGCT)/AIG2-like uncharacterized protein YtfP